MLEMLVYSLESRVRTHLTISGSDVCAKDIEDRFGHTPVERKDVETFWLDPGGFALSDTIPINFEVNGISITIKPEHLYGMDFISTRMLPGDEWVKIYLTHMCVVIPAAAWAEILSVVKALASAHEDGRDLLRQRLKGLPFVRVK